MEVLLKKAKITKSIITQSLVGGHSLYLGNVNYEILGWCNYVDGKSVRKLILLYSKLDNSIVKLPYAQKTQYEIVSKNVQTAKEGTINDWYFPLIHSLKLRLEYSNNVISLANNEKLELIEEAQEKLKTFLNEVHDKGQIYI